MERKRECDWIRRCYPFGPVREFNLRIGSMWEGRPDIRYGRVSIAFEGKCPWNQIGVGGYLSVQPSLSCLGREMPKELEIGVAGYVPVLPSLGCHEREYPRNWR